MNNLEKGFQTDGNQRTTTIFSGKKEAEESRARTQISGRDAGGLIFEIGHDLDEVVMGLYNKDDALIDVGLHDARRDLEEREKAIARGG